MVIIVLASNVSLTVRDRTSVTNVLRDLNLTVLEASIHVLIGPSGCGKTSLLRCLIGFLRPTNGSIEVLGCKPGENGSHVPGVDVGYMPQDIDLNDDLTINEMLTYFGNLLQMQSKLLKQRVDELINVLQLIDKNRLIAELSEGQKRRVCFAASVIHRPRLVLLDEPTVGADPLLREVIWNYMLKLRDKECITFLITTHYIDECKRADVVGFLRKGTMIAQDSPSSLIAKYNVPCLQQAFVKLCEVQEKQQTVNCPNNELYERGTMRATGRDSWKREMNIFLVVIGRIFLRVYKKKTFLLLFFVFEIIEFVVFVSCYGRTPLPLKVGVVNEDITLRHSKHFLDELYANPLLEPKMFTDVDSALIAARKQNVYGFIHIKRFFSETIYNRFIYDCCLNETEVDESTIKCFLDLTNQVIAVTIQRSLQKSFAKTVKQMLRKKGLPKSAYSPIVYGEIIYGQVSDTDLFGARSAMSPQMLIYFRYVHSLQISMFTLMREKNEKIFERNFAAGVKAKHLILSHFVMNFAFSALTSLPFLLTSIHVFAIPCLGSVTTVYALILLQIAAGVCTGMFLSSMSDSLPLVTIFGVAFQFASLFLSGSLWPQQSLPYFVAIFRYFVAFALPNESICNVMVKGLTLNSPLVIRGFIYSLIYILTLFVLTSLKFKF